MNILEIIENARQEISKDTATGGRLGAKIQDLAVKAVIAGFGSDDWKRYMSLFADNKEQLERLTVEKASDASYYPVARAYIVANATCGPDTNTHLARHVEPDFQTGLSDQPDGTVIDDPAPNAVPLNAFVRPVKIPRSQSPGDVELVQ